MDERYDTNYKPKAHPLSIFGSILFPCMWLGAAFCIKEQEEFVQLHWGRYTGLFNTPGCHCSNPCGRSLRTISKKKQVARVPLATVVDVNGTPLEVSAVITYYFANSVRAALAVENPSAYVITQASAVMKQVASKYPYEERQGQVAEHDLKTESVAIGQEAVNLLSTRVEIAGAKILSFAFDQISYSEEIAGGMLKRQQADALIEARSTIVRGAVDIAHDAITQLKNKDIELDEEEKARLISNLMSVICADGNTAGQTKHA